MSTNFPRDSEKGDSGWVSQAEAARIHGVSRQAIHKLVRAGRLRTLEIGGHVLVHRDDVERFRPRPAGRPTSEEAGDYRRIVTILDSCDQSTRDRLYQYLRTKRTALPIETRLGADADVILEALNISGEMTIRMFRGVIAEAAFAVHVARALNGWKSEPIQGNPSYDFRMTDAVGPVRVQVKLQRSQNGQPIIRSDHFLVETQRTRGGKRRGQAVESELTRPYRYGDFDILAVSLQPGTGRWEEFRFTVARWLQPQMRDDSLMATFQPVSQEPNDDWSDDFLTCVGWFRSDSERRIGGNLSKSPSPTRASEINDLSNP